MTEEQIRKLAMAAVVLYAARRIGIDDGTASQQLDAVVQQVLTEAS